VSDANEGSSELALTVDQKGRPSRSLRSLAAGD